VKRNFDGLRWSVPWERTAELETLVFDDWTSRWLFTHRFRKRQEREVTMVNDSTLQVDYSAAGAIVAVALSMHVILPKRLGTKFYVGVDISPGAKTYFAFVYRRMDEVEEQAPVFALSAVEIGACKRLDLDQPGLIKPSGVGFPFPVPDRVVRRHGLYRVHYIDQIKDEQPELGEWQFPHTVAR
jgi:hypothetical protein